MIMMIMIRFISYILYKRLLLTDYQHPCHSLLKNVFFLIQVYDKKKNNFIDIILSTN